MPEHFPFAALVGQDDLKTALLLNAIFPAISGVLIRGEKGTAKSTAARGLARLLPPITVIAGDPYNRPPGDHPDYPGDPPPDAAIIEIPAPFVDLPIGATEDRVVGTLDVSAALTSGKRVVHPGVLAAANRGVLYIDEVNLLPAHLVDALLDAAAMGVNVIEREGVSLNHPARFILIGTMNPEEGDLRPQLLDRFGLMVDVAAPRDLDLRAEVVRRRVAFESDPAGFVAAWRAEDDRLRQRIREAKDRLPSVVLDDATLRLITQICAAYDVDGLRADITLHKTARALAAWEGRDAVSADDVRRAAVWVLPHRRRRQPFEPLDLDRRKLNEILSAPPDATDTPASNDAPDDSPPDHGPDDAPLQTFSASQPQQIKRIRLEGQARGDPGSGRRNPLPNATRGQYTRARATDRPTDVAVDATLRAAAFHGTDTHGRLIIQPSDLREKVRSSTTDTVILFVVDASGSMAARARMEAVKGAVLALLTDAYRQRDRVSVIAFRGNEATTILTPTRSVELAEQQLRLLPTGGRTPLAHALRLAAETIARWRRDQPDQAVLITMLSDGKANVALPGELGDPWTQTLAVAAELAALAAPGLLLDTETGYIRVGRARELATALGFDYLPLDDLSADRVLHPIRARLH